jgi:hypothetical protein
MYQLLLIHHFAFFVKSSMFCTSSVRLVCCWEVVARMIIADRRLGRILSDLPLSLNFMQLVILVKVCNVIISLFSAT